MRRIGISQRIDSYPDRNEVRDALDQRFAEMLWPLGLLAIPLNSRMPDNTAYLAALDLDGFILSGGNDIGEAPERDALEAAVLEYASQKARPVLGICRGMQFINVFCQGSLQSVSDHVAKPHRVIGALADQYGLDQVNSFHGFGIAEQGLGDGLEAIAWSPDERVEAFRHNSKPWLGVMWHPERNTPYETADKHIIADHFGVRP